MLELDRKRKREYLEILGIDQDNIDEEVVKRAYRKLALEFHPDRPNNKHKKEEAEVMFKKVTEAYEALQNNNKSLNVLKNVFKSHQDITSSLEHFFVTTGGNSNLSKLGGSSHNLHNMFQNYVNGQSSTQAVPQAETSSNAASPSTSSNSSLSSFSSLNIPLGGLNGNNFNINLANGSKSNLSKPVPKKGQSLQTTLKITMEESLYGCTKTIEFTRSVTCANCADKQQPTPIKLPSSNAQCRDCGGKGVLTAVIAGGSVTTACPSCHAASLQTPQTTSPSTTKDQKETCTKCNGAGRIPNKRTVMVNVAPGVTNGMQQLYEAEGDEGTFGGPFGDLIVKFDVEVHPFYQRHGDDAMCKVTIPFPHAVLGTMIEIPLIYGALQSTPSGISISSSKMAVQIDAGVQQNQVVKVSQQGFLNSIDGKRGDLYIQILVDVPPKSALDDEERELLRKLASKPNFKFGKHNANAQSILACSLLEETPVPSPPPAKIPAMQAPLSPNPQRLAV